jgi:long-chain acyl-CoA synthetase
LRDIYRSLGKRRGEPVTPTPEPPLERPYPWESTYPEGLSWNFSFEAQPLYQILDDAVAKWPDRPCLSFFGKQYSYAEVGSLVNRLAQGLQELGAQEGARVGLLLPNTPYYVICFHAILKTGATVVNINPLYAERGIARQIEDSGCKLVITLDAPVIFNKIAPRIEDSTLEKIIVCPMSGVLSLTKKTLFLLFRRDEIAKIPSNGSFVKYEKLIDNKGDFQPPAIDPKHGIAVLQYTGGTTGIPKGAMLTHASLYANTLQTRLWAKDFREGEEKVLAVLPLFHVFGMTAVMNLGLLCGGELLLVPRFKATELVEDIKKEKPTILMGVPTIYSALNALKTEEGDLSSLRYCISGGAPLPLKVKETFESLTGCTLVEGYGLTECGPVCTINPDSGPDKPGSAGLPIPGTLIEILSLENPEHRLAIGDTGEIAITGPQVMLGYLHRPEDTEQAFSRGRLRTGDVGYMDQEGYLYIIDRIKDLILSGGFNVYPRMVEEAVMLHSAVEEVAVVGVPDRHRGEVVKAFVKKRAGTELSAIELKAFLKDKLAPFEQPRRIEFRNQIPKTMIGKPLRRQLLEEEQEEAKKSAA